MQRCKVFVHDVRGEKMEVDLCDTEEQFKSVTVLQLKEKIAQRLPDDADVESLRLIFTDKDLDEDSRPLCEYGVQHMSVIHMTVIVTGDEWLPDSQSGGMGSRSHSREDFSDF